VSAAIHGHPLGRVQLRIPGSRVFRALLLLELSAYPGFIAATKIGSCRDDGAFFLDFSRPLVVERWLGLLNLNVRLKGPLYVKP